MSTGWIEKSVPSGSLFIPQQFVDRQLRPRHFIPLLDDDGAIQAVAAVLGRQAAGDGDSAGRHLAVEEFAGQAVVDFGALADVDAHRFLSCSDINKFNARGWERDWLTVLLQTINV